MKTHRAVFFGECFIHPFRLVGDKLPLQGVQDGWVELYRQPATRDDPKFPDLRLIIVRGRCEGSVGPKRNDGAENTRADCDGSCHGLPPLLDRHGDSRQRPRTSQGPIRNLRPLLTELDTRRL